MTTMGHSLDLTQIRISPLKSKADVSRFNCGEREIDSWFEKAHKHSEKNRARVFLARSAGDASVKGFYSLSFSTEAREKLAKPDRQAWPTGIPLVYVYYLAVQRSCQCAGLGTFLLLDALKRAHWVSKQVAFYGVGLRSLNDRTTKLYTKFGFAIAPDEGRIPLMILPIWSINDLFEGKGQ